MLLFIPVFILITAAIAVLILQFVPRGMGIAWFVSILFSLLALISVLMLRNFLPQSFSWKIWNSIGMENLSISFRLDGITWGFAVMIYATVAALLFLASSRLGIDSDPKDWVAIIFFGIIGVLGVTTSNILTVIFVLAFLDLIEIGIMLFNNNQVSMVETNFYLYWRVLGLLLMVAAFSWQISADNASGNWINVTQGPSHLILFASMLRLGIFPVERFRGIIPKIENVTELLRKLVSFLVMVSLIVQLPYYPFSRIVFSLLIIYLLVSLFTNVVYIKKEQDQTKIINEWLGVISCVVIATFVLGFPAFAIFFSFSSLGLTLLLFSKVTPSRISKYIGYFALLSFSGLPFTPNSTSFEAFGRYSFFPGLLFIIPISISIYSVYYLLIKISEMQEEYLEQWTKILVPVGLFIPLVTTWVIYLLNLDFRNILQISIPGLIITFISIGLIINAKINIIKITKYGSILPRMKIISKIDNFKPGKYFPNEIASVLKFPLLFLRELFEGEGGFLWAILSLVLIFTLVSGIGAIQ